MLTDASIFNFAMSEPFDTVVIGAGAVGLPLAVNLARAGQRVALLEAGPERPDAASQRIFETAKAIERPMPGIHHGRFRNLGGTSVFWGGQLVKFSPTIFEPRAWVSEASWPISATDLEHWYQEAFNMLGLSNAIFEDQLIWSRLKLTPPPTTKTITPFFTRWAPETNFAIHFAEYIETALNLTIILNGHVCALDVSERGEVNAAELLIRTGQKARVFGKDFILANGTVEISRLLLSPTVDHQAPPWGINEWVGRCFFDHIDCFAGSVKPIDQKKFTNFFDNVLLDGYKYSPKLRLADEVQKEDELLDISAHLIYSSSISENIADLKTLMKGIKKGKLHKAHAKDIWRLATSLKFVIPMAFRYLRYRRMLNFADKGIQLRLTGEQSPKVESRISLSNDLDDLGLRSVAVDWKVDSRDLLTIRRFAHLLKDYLHDAQIAEVTLDSRLTKNDASFLSDLDDANHQMGGARMASDASSGVVDMNCRVFGSVNLYVAGAAVYPTSGFGNPTLTAIALGLRLASHILSTRQSNGGHNE